MTKEEAIEALRDAATMLDQIKAPADVIGFYGDGDGSHTIGISVQIGHINDLGLGDYGVAFVKGLAKHCEGADLLSYDAGPFVGSGYEAIRVEKGRAAVFAFIKKEDA